MDGNFIFAALKVKLDIRERLGKLLQGEAIRIHVLKSVLIELTNAGSKTAAALEFAKSFCDVIDDTAFEGETPVEKLKAMLGKLCVAKTLQTATLDCDKFLTAESYIAMINSR